MKKRQKAASFFPDGEKTHAKNRPQKRIATARQEKNDEMLSVLLFLL